MFVKLWGVRGSVSSPTTNEEYQEKIHKILQFAILTGLRDQSDIRQFLRALPPQLTNVVGGNTTCISVAKTRKTIPIIVDAGTGIRAIGDELMSKGCGPGEGCEIHIFFTHTHWDHIQGLPFFKPIYFPGNTIHIYSPLNDIESRISRQMEPAYFPVSMDQLAAKFHFHTIQDETIDIDGVEIDQKALRHPGGSTAYRFRYNDRIFIFATDAEFTGSDLEHEEVTYSPFFHDADLVALDAQYTLNESFNKFDWGHTSVTMAVNCAIRWKVKNLILTHHEPAYSDELLFGNLSTADNHRELQKSSYPRIFLGREGMAFQLGE